MVPQGQDREQLENAALVDCRHIGAPFPRNAGGPWVSIVDKVCRVKA
jgi:hypothetical protein